MEKLSRAKNQEDKLEEILFALVAYKAKKMVDVPGALHPCEKRDPAIKKSLKK
ncbi:MAG: hypothetical protein HY070_02785 [Chloroflexi bacterium]|nr:hypothetical protein [Chloroflexota bacterium]MBI3741385.1 hypothetical protein [Chloroflexota bacterium]